jgi:hypothetical protein
MRFALVLSTIKLAVVQDAPPLYNGPAAPDAGGNPAVPPGTVVAPTVTDASAIPDKSKAADKTKKTGDKTQRAEKTGMSSKTGAAGPAGSHKPHEAGKPGNGSEGSKDGKGPKDAHCNVTDALCQTVKPYKCQKITRFPSNVKRHECAMDKCKPP